MLSLHLNVLMQGLYGGALWEAVYVRQMLYFLHANTILLKNERQSRSYVMHNKGQDLVLTFRKQEMSLLFG